MRKKYLLLLFVSIVGRVWGQLPSIDLSFNTGAGYGGDINDIVLQPDGKIITAGRFKYIDNTTRYYIARLNYNGSIDSTFIPSGNIFGNNYGWRLNKAVLQPDGKIIIGGYFFSVEGVNRNYIARLNDNGSLDTTFASSGIGFNNIVNAIIIQPDGKIIIGGSFTTYDSIASNRIIRLNVDGTLDSTFNIGSGFFDYAVKTLALQQDGKILVGGSFSYYQGLPFKSIIRLNTDGSIDQSFSPGQGPSGWHHLISTIAIQPDNKIVIGGDFQQFDGTVQNCIARLNNDGSIDPYFITNLGFDIPFDYPSVNSIVIQADGKILAGGRFITFNGMPRNLFTRLNSNGSLDTLFEVGDACTPVSDPIAPEPSVNIVVIQPDNKIILGGKFSFYNDTISRYIVRLDNSLVGISPIDKEIVPTIIIYPNPATTELTITGYVPAYLKLYNTLGQTVAEANKSNKMYVGNLPHGLYVLQLFDAKGEVVKTGKVIVGK